MRRTALALLCLPFLIAGACSGDDDSPSDEAAELLEEAGLLDDGAVAIGPAGPDDDAVNMAICDYVFGTSKQVSDRLGVDVATDEDSGFHNLGNAGGGLRCIYYDGDDDPVFAIGFWSPDAVNTDAAGNVTVTIDASSGDTGVASYNDDFTGDTVGEDELVEWLEDADSRWAGQSV